MRKILKNKAGSALVYVVVLISVLFLLTAITLTGSYFTLKASRMNQENSAHYYAVDNCVDEYVAALANEMADIYTTMQKNGTYSNDAFITELYNAISYSNGGGEQPKIDVSLLWTPVWEDVINDYSSSDVIEYEFENSDAVLFDPSITTANDTYIYLPDMSFTVTKKTSDGKITNSETITFDLVLFAPNSTLSSLTADDILECIQISKWQRS